MNETPDEALLDSALNKPVQRFAYSDKTSIFNLATSYSYGLAKNHPFLDGNKSTTLTIATVFLEINDYKLTAPNQRSW